MEVNAIVSTVDRIWLLNLIKMWNWAEKIESNRIKSKFIWNNANYTSCDSNTVNMNLCFFFVSLFQMVKTEFFYTSYRTVLMRLIVNPRPLKWCRYECVCVSKIVFTFAVIVQCNSSNNNSNHKHTLNFQCFVRCQCEFQCQVEEREREKRKRTKIKFEHT